MGKLLEMGKFTKLLQQNWVMLIGRGSVVSLAILVLPALMSQVPYKAELQIEDTAWRALAVNFLAAPDSFPNITKATTPYDFRLLETFNAEHIDRALVDEKQLDCLTTAIYYEARSEPVAGQLAVAQVVLNRTKSKHYPSTVCEVVYQGSKRITGCQFSFTCDGSLQIAPRAKPWARTRASAINAMLEMNSIPLGRATHYHTLAVNPVWSATLLRTANVGTHVFYRFPNRREKAILFKDI
ncbi:MAG: cell wall hydrolase [Robiginitomaculum sp.]|nr:cell wall hydrolase [Robiginitomaculum sp.]